MCEEQYEKHYKSVWDEAAAQVGSAEQRRGRGTGQETGTCRRTVSGALKAKPGGSNFMYEEMKSM